MGLVGTIGVLALDCEFIDSCVDCKGCGVVVAQEPLGDADELEAEGGVLDTCEPPPFDVEEDLPGVFPLAYPHTRCLFYSTSAFSVWAVSGQGK